ncbi:hypothetical protein [Kribbella sp. NPDC055071]
MMVDAANSESVVDLGAIARRRVDVQSTWEFLPRADVDALRVTVRIVGEAANICFSDRSNEYNCVEADEADLEDFRSLLVAIIDGQASLAVSRFLGSAWIRSVHWPGGVWAMPISPIMLLLPQRVVRYEPYVQAK